MGSTIFLARAHELLFAFRKQRRGTLLLHLHLHKMAQYAVAEGRHMAVSTHDCEQNAVTFSSCFFLLNSTASCSCFTWVRTRLVCFTALWVHGSVDRKVACEVQGAPARVLSGFFDARIRRRSFLGVQLSQALCINGSVLGEWVRCIASELLHMSGFSRTASAVCSLSCSAVISAERQRCNINCSKRVSRETDSWARGNIDSTSRLLTIE